MPQKLQIGKHRQKAPVIGNHRQNIPLSDSTVAPTPLPSPQAAHSIGGLAPDSSGASRPVQPLMPPLPMLPTPSTDTATKTQEQTPEAQLDAKPPSPEEELAAFKTKVETTFGIKLDNSAGVKAMYKSFTKAAGVSYKQVHKGAKPKEWTSEELGYLEEALKNYGPLLGANRPKEIGDQPISTLSRTEVLIEPDETTGAFSKDKSTLGVTFGSDNISMFDKALQPSDFATSGQQFRGTIEHELSHALIEDLPVIAKGKQSTMINKFAKELNFWTGRYISPYWKLKDGTPGNTEEFDNAKTRKAAQDAGIETPITDYGMTNAEEDLAEAMMYFFEEPGKLKASCPLRFQFILDNIKQYLDPEKVKLAEQL